MLSRLWSAFALILPLALSPVALAQCPCGAGCACYAQAPQGGQMAYGAPMMRPAVASYDAPAYPASAMPFGMPSGGCTGGGYAFAPPSSYGMPPSTYGMPPAQHSVTFSTPRGVVLQYHYNRSGGYGVSAPPIQFAPQYSAPPRQFAPPMQQQPMYAQQPQTMYAQQPMSMPMSAPGGAVCPPGG